MKKLLILSAFALACFATMPAKAVSSLEDGKVYMIRNVSKDLWLNLDTPGFADSGNNACVDETATWVVANVNPENANEWSFRHAEPGKIVDDYLYLGVSGWNSIRNSTTRDFWTIELVDADDVDENTLRCRLNNEHKGNTGYLGTQTFADNETKSRSLWCNATDDATHQVVWDIIPAPVRIITAIFKASSDDTDPIEKTYIVADTETAFNSYVGFDCQNTEDISDTNTSATYQVKPGTPMRIYNERADMYVYINGSLVQQTEDKNAPATNLLKVNLDDDGGFAIFCPSEKKFVGYVDADNATFPAGLLCAQKYYTGKYKGDYVNDGNKTVYYPVYADWFSINPDGSGLSCFNDLQTTPRTVCRWARVDEGSKWILITDQENFEANWELRNELLGYKKYLDQSGEILGITEDADFMSLCELASDFKFGGNVNDPIAEETLTELQKIKATVEDAVKKKESEFLNTTSLFTIVSIPYGQDASRGALIYDADTQRMTTTGTNVEADTSNPNHLWGFIKVGEGENTKYYLYNYAAEKFASAYELRDPAISGGTATYVWNLSDVPTAIDLNYLAHGVKAVFDSNTYAIEGGKNNSDENPAGMMIINGPNDANIQRVPCSLGEGGKDTDGTGFIFTVVEYAEGQEVKDSAMKAKAESVLANINEKIDAIAVVIEGEDYNAETHGKQVGHYKEEAVNTFGAAIASAKEQTDAQEAYYAAIEAKAEFNKDASFRTVENGNVYTITEGNNIHYTDGNTHLSASEMPSDLDAKMKNWIASVDENGLVSFVHNHDAAPAVSETLYATAPINFAVDDVTKFSVNRTAQLGKVTLGDNTDKIYTITHVSANAADATTTHIAEINGDENAVKAVYDLQGRKLAAPAKGINIINGKKILVK